MHIEHYSPIHLDIPFYRQHWAFTCGPASLMMAMKYLDTDFQLVEDLEIDLWREGNLVEVHGTSRYGLAFSAAIRGFQVRVTSNTGGIDYVDRLDPIPAGIDMEVLRGQFDERKARCMKLGVLDLLEPITGEKVYAALLQNHVPLLVTNTRWHSQESLPHWIVVTGIDDKCMYFNDPLDASRGIRTFSQPDLRELIGFLGDQSMVEVWK